jgi:hypothetical protein
MRYARSLIVSRQADTETWHLVSHSCPIRPVEQAIGYSQSQQETGDITVVVGVSVQSFAGNCSNRIHRDSQRFKRWEMNNNQAPLRAAEVIALECQRKVAVQSAIAVYSGAQPEQQYALYPTEKLLEAPAL